MIKKILFLLVILTFIGGIVFYLWKLLQPARAELEIETVPAVTVYLNGKEVGKTPYKNFHLQPGSWKIKLAADGQNSFWERQLTVPASTRLFIDRMFKNGSSQGRVIYLTPNGNSQKAGCILTSMPPKASVSIDGKMRGNTPLAIENLDSGQHHFVFALPGHRPIEVMAKTTIGYRLVVEIDFNPSAKTAKTTSSAALKTEKKLVAIKKTPTGWLRVRQQPTRSSKEIARVIPGNKYPYLEEKNGWFRIEYQPGRQGWISAIYAAR